MKRIMAGVISGLAIWFGSALAAEAQVITPSGPLVIQVGTNNWDYTAAIYLPTPMNFKVITSVWKNGVCQNTFTQNVPNPGTNTYSLTQPCQVTFNIGLTDVVVFKSQLLWNRTTTNAIDLTATILGTRPSSKKVERRLSMSVQSADRDRRRE